MEPFLFTPHAGDQSEERSSNDSISRAIDPSRAIDCVGIGKSAGGDGYRPGTGLPLFSHERQRNLGRVACWCAQYRYSVIRLAAVAVVGARCAQFL